MVVVAPGVDPAVGGELTVVAVEDGEGGLLIATSISSVNTFISDLYGSDIGAGFQRLCISNRILPGPDAENRVAPILSGSTGM